MKKRNLLLVILTITLCLTGCIKTGGEVFSDSLDAMDDVDSLKIKANIDMETEIDGTLVSATFPLTIALDDDNFNIKAEKNSIINELDIYGNVLDDRATIYFLSSLVEKNDSTWSKITLKENEASKNELKKYEDLNVSRILQEDKFVYIDRVEDIKHYEMIIDDELLERIAKSLNEEVKKINKTIKLDFYIDIITNRIVKMELDLKEFLTSMNQEDLYGLKLEEIKKMLISIEFSDFDTTRVIIPKEIIESAKEYNSNSTDSKEEVKEYDNIQFNPNVGGSVIEGDFNFDKENVYEYEY